MIHYLIVVSLISSTASFGVGQDDPPQNMSQCACEMPERNDQQRLCSPEINFLTHVKLAGNGNPRCHQPDNIDFSDPRCMSKVYTFESTKVGGNLTIEISTPTDVPACELTPVPGIKYAISGNHFQKEVFKCGEITGGDMVLVVDTSGSIGFNNFNNIVKPFLKNIVTAVSPASGVSPVNFGTVTFASTASLEFGLGSRTSSAVQTLIDNLPFPGTRTAIGDALRLTANGVLTAPFDTDSNPNICIVLTDGQSNEGIPVQVGATELKAKCETIFAVGIGNNVNDITLMTIASDSDKAIRVNDITELTETLVKVITQQICTPTGETKSVCNARNCVGIFKPATHEEFHELKDIYEGCST